MREKIKVDTMDKDLLTEMHWSLHPSMRSDKLYLRRAVRSRGETTRIYLHRVVLERILGRPLRKGEQVDHINGDGLDNRRSNLRLASHAQSMRNSRKKKTCSSQYKGVSWVSHKKSWRAQIEKNGKRSYLGYFHNEQDAARAYNVAAKEHFGEFARLNEGV